MSKKSKILFAIAGVIIAAVLIFAFQIYSAMFSYKTKRLDDNLTIFIGASCNSAVFISNDKNHIIIIDPKMKTTAEKLKKYINRISENPEITIINTHSHYDHTTGNDLYPEAKIISGNHNNELWKIETQTSRLPDIKIPADEELLLEIDNEKIHIKNMGRAHTYNDVIVYFENRKVLFTGDLVFYNIHPAMFKESGTIVDKWIDALTELHKNYDTELVIPGHGLTGNKKIIAEMKEYFVSIKDSVGNEENLEKLRNKYKNYFSVPNMTSFNNTVEFSK